MKIRVLVYCLLLMCSAKVWGQTDPVFSLVRLYPQILNPTFVGASEKNEVIIVNRNQWITMPGTPMTTAFLGNFNIGEKIGVGFTSFLDQLGPIKATSINGDLAYHIPMNNNWAFSGAIRIGVTNLKLDFDGVSLLDRNDEMFNQNYSTGLQVNSGWGIRLAKSDRFYVAISQPRMLWNDFGLQTGKYKDASFFYGMVGKKQVVNENISLSSNAVVRVAQDLPLSYDVNLTAGLNNLLDVGFSYRNQNAIGFNLGIQFSPTVYLGYQYEIPINTISNVTNQTHEFVLKFQFERQ
ncbi:PorP/SprF family type IX secretion system membrane protein [Aquirufa sp. KTFRIE-69F]|uniref:PorP/SprF family type IX secretion system membrane protein n=1 Tax=Aquirufa originis TaxID=3096514 RepID=A0ABW6D7A5_9BACT